METARLATFWAARAGVLDRPRSAPDWLGLIGWTQLTFLLAWLAFGYFEVQQIWLDETDGRAVANWPVLNEDFDVTILRGAWRYGINHNQFIVLDGKVLSAPVIREPITGGSGQISGNFSVEDTVMLSALMPCRVMRWGSPRSTNTLLPGPTKSMTRPARAHRDTEPTVLCSRSTCQSIDPRTSTKGR